MSTCDVSDNLGLNLAIALASDNLRACRGSNRDFLISRLQQVTDNNVDVVATQSLRYLFA